MSSRAAFTAQGAVGVVTGIIAATLAAFFAAALTASPLDSFFPLLTGALVYPIGAAVGVTLIGRRLDQHGRFWFALIGAFAALMVMALLAGSIGSIEGLLTGIGIVFILLSPIFSTLAFHRFGRPGDAPWDAYDKDVDLLQYHDEGWEDD